ncbi:hypothetical protein BDQ17DRAFT_1335448 [Cyathus striatus]|nr:hypothetical protein BDQ17DRAFT_1335448 [Cyathus striatus]
MSCSNIALSCIPQAQVGGAELLLIYDKVPPDMQFSGLILLWSMANNCLLPSLQWSDGVNYAIDPETHKLKDTSEILFYDSESSTIPLPQTAAEKLDNDRLPTTNPTPSLIIDHLRSKRKASRPNAS